MSLFGKGRLTMKVQDIMHKDPVCCLLTHTLKEAAEIMVECDCGAVPVVAGETDMKLIGMVTDRDIVCRAVALGKNPMEAKVSSCFSSSVVAVTPERTLEECLKLMEKHQVRRLPVIDALGACCGVVTQAQIAKYASEEQSARLLREVSRKSEETPVEVPL